MVDWRHIRQRFVGNNPQLYHLSGTRPLRFNVVNTIGYSFGARRLVIAMGLESEHAASILDINAVEYENIHNVIDINSDPNYMGIDGVLAYNIGFYPVVNCEIRSGMHNMTVIRIE